MRRFGFKCRAFTKKIFQIFFRAILYGKVLFWGTIWVQMRWFGFKYRAFMGKWFLSFFSCNFVRYGTFREIIWVKKIWVKIWWLGFKCHAFEGKFSKWKSLVPYGNWKEICVPCHLRFEVSRNEFVHVHIFDLIKFLWISKLTNIGINFCSVIVSHFLTMCFSFDCSLIDKWIRSCAFF